MKSGTWTRLYVEQEADSPSMSIQSAIQEWNMHWRRLAFTNDSSSSSPVRYVDRCREVRCNSQCPETITLYDLNNQRWTDAERYILIGLTLLIALLAVGYKTVMFAWKHDLIRNYHHFIDANKEDCRDNNGQVST